MVKKVKDEWAPLSAGFMLTSIIGFLVSIWLIMDLSATWGFTFAFFFVLMFIASFISMSKAEPVPEHMIHLAIHEPKKAYSTRKPKPVEKSKKMKWFEPVFFVFLLGWIYYIFHFFSGSVYYTPVNIAVVFLALNVFFAIYFLVDILSAEFLYTWEQAIFSILIIVTAGYGVYYFPIAGIGSLIYYLHWKIVKRF